LAVAGLELAAFASDPVAREHAQKELEHKSEAANRAERQAREAKNGYAIGKTSAAELHHAQERAAQARSEARQSPAPTPSPAPVTIATRRD
jgi:hypothetical protein